RARPRAAFPHPSPACRHPSQRLCLRRRGSHIVGSCPPSSTPCREMKPTVPVRKRSLQRGMSAVELAIVLGIGATLAATAGPDFSGFFANVQLRVASDNL